MAKKFVQDVVPAGRRSIRNIPLPGDKIDTKESLTDKRKKVSAPAVSQNGRGKKPVNKPRSGSGFSRFRIWIVAVFVFAVLVYAGSFLFVTATVTAMPKKLSLPLDVTSSAAFENETVGLSYTVVSLNREGTKEVQVDGEEKVEKKASGRIVVYNNYSSAAQTLVKNTRFESPSGLIYRIQGQVSVPGLKTIGGVTTPGSVTVTIYADKAGDQYNIGLSDFTIPGFKGDPKFSKITAKSDPGSPLGGGLIGTVGKMTEASRIAAKTSLENGLKSELEQSLRSQVPDSHVMFSGAATFSFEELPQEKGASPSSMIMKEKGTIYGILFDKSKVSDYIASTLIQTSNKDVYIDNIDSVRFAILNANTFDPRNPKDISFSLKGDPKFIWNIDTKELSEQLAGQKRRNINTILAKFDSVDRANVAIKPFWLFKLPRQPERIEVLINNDL